MRDQYATSLRWYCRGLGLVFAAAFLSWALQALGLVGAQGILPIAAWIADAAPWSIYRFGGSDAAILAFGWFGAAAGLAAAFGLVQAPALAICVWLYASVIVAGQEFMTFQWDLLLIECGVIGFIVCPWHWRDKNAWIRPQPSTSIWLLRWLLWRLMFQSGYVKLASGDPTWRDLSALSFHFETQPLPNPFSWYADALPGAVLGVGAAMTLVIELILPFGVFLPRRGRNLTLAAFALLQLGIIATGNYGFFNLLTLLLCLSLVSDADWRRWLSPNMLARVGVFPPTKAPARFRQRLVTAYLTFAVVVGGGQTLQMLLPRAVPDFIAASLANVRPFMIVNRYGLFAVMTTVRNEIEVEGSNDGRDWRPYEFKYKPGQLDRTPALVVGHMPRLDWQMWFAALGRAQDQRWLQGFMAGLLTGSPAVLDLLESSPFASPPRFIRAQLFRYEFSTFELLRERGIVWRREFVGSYMPPVELRR